MFFSPVVLLIALAAMIGETAQAADSQPYSVEIAKTADDGLNQALHDVSTLVGLNKTAPVDSFALVARAQEDIKHFTAALRSFGYYNGSVTVKIANRPLDDPELTDLLERTAAGQAVNVSVAVETGMLFRLGKVEISGNIPSDVQDKSGLITGAPARAADVLAARDKLLQALLEQGYPLAKVSEPDASLQPDTNTLDVVYRVETGPLADVGDIGIKGLKQVNESFVRNRLLLKPGERFNTVAIDKARQDLSSLGIFSSVRVRPAEYLDDSGRLPVDFEVKERPARVLNLETAYSTDLGGSLSTAWQHRNLLGNAEQLNLSAAVTQLGGNSTRGIGYNAAASFIKPEFLARDQSLQADLKYVQQNLIAYNKTGALGDVLLNRRFAPHWSGSAGLAVEQSRVTQEGETRDYTLIGLPLILKYDSTDNLLDPSQGIRAEAGITPTQSLASHRNAIFLQSQLSASAYMDLSGNRRSILALRGLVYEITGAGRFDLPPDKRAYAGGSGTVRGYKFQSIGPQFPDNKPQGGSALSAATVEFRQRILDNWGAVFFADAGQANAGGSPFSSNWLVGVGAGIRYYTSFGPIRLDVAVPVNPQPGSGSFELYIGLGQAF